MKTPNGKAAAEKTAILVVNDGKEAFDRDWLSLCLKRLAKHTPSADYAVYLWENNAKALGSCPSGVACRLERDPKEKLMHPHAVPLQRLYERAKMDGLKTIVTLDNDAFPIRDGWLAELVGHLNQDTVLAGVWRDELVPAIQAYIHPSCLCTTVAFVEGQGLRFDQVDISPQRRLDTLLMFTQVAQQRGFAVHPLYRSNRNQLHYLMGGVYGDYIYHHGAGSRPSTQFWSEENSPHQVQRNTQLNRRMQQVLYEHERCFIAWLRGDPDLQSTGDPGWEAFARDLEALRIEFDLMDTTHA